MMTIRNSRNLVEQTHMYFPEITQSRFLEFPIIIIFLFKKIYFYQLQ